MTCEHEQVFEIAGKTSDMNGWNYPNGLTGEGYVPTSIIESGSSDYLEIIVCCDCSKLLNFNPGAVEQAQNHAIIKTVLDYIAYDEFTLENVIENIPLSEDIIRKTLKFLVDGDIAFEKDGFFGSEYSYDEYF
jgi:hypothetical protein